MHFHTPFVLSMKFWLLLHFSHTTTPQPRDLTLHHRLQLLHPSLPHRQQVSKCRLQLQWKQRRSTAVPVCATSFFAGGRTTFGIWRFNFVCAPLERSSTTVALCATMAFLAGGRITFGPCRLGAVCVSLDWDAMFESTTNSSAATKPILLEQ